MKELAEWFGLELAGSSLDECPSMAGAKHMMKVICLRWTKLAWYLGALYTGQTMILLVEDDIITRKAFAQALRSHGHEVREAADGNEALALLEQSHFDVVITDMVMPNLNGLGLIAQIRADWPRTPILLMSGYVSQYAGQTIMSGEAEFLRKPIDSPVLIATVQRLLAVS
jgi:CheY-like chemotaxis protein